MPSPRIDDVKALARWLDSSIRLPFGVRIGWDGLIGLVPVGGNVATTGASLYIVGRAAQLGCSEWVLLRMGFNLVVDNLFDGVPLFGTIFDFAWKANEMNVRLLERQLANPARTRRRSRWFLALVFALITAGLLATAALTIWIAILLIRWAGPRIA